MDPQQELFTALLLAIQELGYDVYDGLLPPDGTPYPFVYLADSMMTDDANKTAVFGDAFQTIHVWHNDPKRRGTVSAMLLNIKNICRRLEHTEHFAWDLRSAEQRILADDTTKSPLLHGVLELGFKFS